MKLKLDEKGNVVLQDGKPVYVHDDGKEVAFDAPATVATISRLNAEAKSHREGKEAAEKLLKAFEGLDAEAARKAVEQMQNVDAKKLIDAGEVEKVKADIARSFAEKLDAAEKRAADAEARFADSEIGRAFAGSALLVGESARYTLPPEVARATFGKYFAMKDGKISATDSNGNPIYSREKPGELAGFDEALSSIVEGCSFKDSITRSTGSSGSGAQNGTSGTAGKQTQGNFGGSRDERMAALKMRFPELK